MYPLSSVALAIFLGLLVKTTIATPAAATKPNYWFSFGDSYTASGFDINGTLPSAKNPIGNPTFPGATTVAGGNWLTFTTATYNRSLVFTYNYAYGGATIDRTIVAPGHASYLTLTDQVNEFLTSAGKKPASTPWTSANSLFSIWIGINDINNSYTRAVNHTTLSETLLDAYFALVQKLYGVGARNFLFVNVPPIDRSPELLRDSTADQALEKSIILNFNSQLAAKIKTFQSANSGVKTYLYDSNAQFTTILNSPKTYGFTDATSIGSKSTDFWGNSIHPTPYAHKYFAQEVGKTVLANTIW